MRIHLRRHLAAEPPELFTEADINALAESINKAERPLIYAGGGVIIAKASDKLVKLAEKADIPVVSTLMTGSYPQGS